MRINYKKLNPVGFHLLELLPDPTVRQIILYGGSSSSKSYSVAQCFLIMIMREGQSMLVMRKVGASIRDSIYKSFRRAAEQLGITHYFQFKDGVKIIKCLLNDAEIIFKGLDDSEKIKGLESIKRVFMDEWSEYEEDDYKQMKLRLRGMEGQQLIFAFNPIKETHWIKKNVFDKEVWHDVPMTVTLGGMTLPPQLTEVKTIRMNAPKSFMHKRTGELITHPSDMIAIQSTYLNNFWVVGSPDGTYGYYDEQCIANFENERLNDPDYYNVYALGEWGVIRTGSEFFGSFNRGIHCTECKYNPELPIHVSVDNNVLPYISYSFWQIDYTDGKTIYQIDELPAESPNNTARKSALLVARKLKDLGVYKIFLHGDASTRNASTIDDQKRSFLDLVIDTLQKEGLEVVDCVGNKNPSVPMSGEFINTIFEKKLPGLTIFISEQCKTAIEDYMSVQKDENGGMLKTRVKNKTTGQSYEEHGHMCFVPETPVVTARGNIPIKDVAIGDYVLTEKGWQKVYNSLCTIRKSQYFFVNLNGQVIGCTYEHRVHTQRGFIPACDLKEGDIITRLIDNNQWQEKLSYSTATDFIATLIANVKAIENIIVDGLGLKESLSKPIYTAICGILLTGKFIKGIVYIILMAITTIIHFLILPLCLLTSMRSFILRSMEKKHGIKFIKAWLRREKPQQNGTDLTKDENGIKRMEKTFGKISQWLNTSAKFVVRYLRVIPNRLRNFVQITAKANGDVWRDWTMKSAFVRCAGLNLLSIDILKRNAVHGNALLRIGGVSDVFDISTNSQTFFANGVLVHNSDTFRYVVCDLLKEEFLAFSNRRKRNLYAKDGAIHFYNPDTECKYTADIVYCMPNINSKFVLVYAKKCGERWHITHIRFLETTSTEEMKQALAHCNSGQVVLECPKSYYIMARELRDGLSGDVRVLHESGDMARRIAAMSDYVKNNILFNEQALNEDLEYSAYMTNLLDYNKDSGENIEASAVLSGLVQTVVKLGL